MIPVILPVLIVLHVVCVAPFQSLAMDPQYQNNQQFSTQIMARVSEHLADYMQAPVEMTNRMVSFYNLGGFPNHMQATDRNVILKFMVSEGRTAQTYYGLEDGTYLWNSDDPTNPYMWYREPGQSGYSILLQNDTTTTNTTIHSTTTVPPEMEKFAQLCLTHDGQPRECRLQENDLYIQCINDCAVAPCPTQSPSIHDSNNTTNNNTHWCPQYTIKETTSSDTNLGFLPTMYYCSNATGLPEQTPGKVVTNLVTGELGQCFYFDQTTPLRHDVPRLAADYRYCGNDRICNTTYIGSFANTTYDPRFRGWYILTKQRQSAVWSDPYPFFDNDVIGITFSQPIYRVDRHSGRRTFYGVVAFDYTLEQISQFLVDQYNGTSVGVLIVEEASPHYVIAASSGSDTASPPCRSCDPVRIVVDDFSQGTVDVLLQNAFYRQRNQGFPTNELVPVKQRHSNTDPSSETYVAQSEIFEQGKDNLQWRVIVLTSVDRIVSDSVLPSEGLFAVIITVGLTGFGVCFAMFCVFLSKRREPAVIQADWRFTCSFIFFCSLLNLSSFTWLGELSDGICMLRMWFFNLLFPCAMSPLLVKVWRMYRIVGASSGFRRKAVSHYQAAIMTLPIIAVEILLLIVFSFVDPSGLGESLEVTDGYATKYLSCEQDSQLFFGIQTAYHFLLVLVGCVLAYLTRNLDSRYGEARQLVFAMYNIAFTGIVIATILQLIDTDQSGSQILRAIGTLWGTVLGASAFAVPRLFTVARENSRAADAPSSARRAERALAREQSARRAERALAREQSASRAERVLAREQHASCPVLPTSSSQTTSESQTCAFR